MLLLPVTAEDLVKELNRLDWTSKPAFFYVCRPESKKKKGNRACNAYFKITIPSLIFFVVCLFWIHIKILGNCLMIFKFESFTSKPVRSPKVMVTQPGVKISWKKSPEQKWKKLKKSGKMYLKIQMNICVELQFFSKHWLESVKNVWDESLATRWRIKVIGGNADQQTET